jgi:hypothetical protein
VYEYAGRFQLEVVYDVSNVLQSNIRVKSMDGANIWSKAVYAMRLFEIVCIDAVRPACSAVDFWTSYSVKVLLG